MNTEQNKEIISRLLKGKLLDDLGLAVKNNRIDLNGLTVPEPTPVGKMRTAITDIVTLEGLVKVQNATWQSLDFSGSRLPHLLFFNCLIDNCVFDHSYCRDWGLWSTKVTNCSFQSTDLRNAALGGVDNGQRNSFRQVNFTEANLCGTAYTAAEFVGCKFKNTRLNKIDFQTSTFTDCIFEGELRNVMFYKRGFEGEAFPANEMINVDFSRAQLRFVEFRGLDLDKVIFPQNTDHLIIDNYLHTLDRVLNILRSREDIISKRLAAYLGIMRKWAGTKQHRGILNKKDISEVIGENALVDLLKLIGESF